MTPNLKNQIQDPRLTQYVLNEISNEDRVQVEAWIKDNPQVRQAVEEIRLLTSALQEELQNEKQADVVPSLNERITLFSGKWKKLFAIAVPVATAATLILTAIPIYQQKIRENTFSMVVPTSAPVSVEAEQPENFATHEERKQTAAPPPVKPAPSVVPPSPADTGVLAIMGKRKALGGAALGNANTRQKFAASSDGASGITAFGQGPGKAIYQLPAEPPVEMNREAYSHITDNGFLNVSENPLSTFSVDVDTASYANVRRFLESHQLPPKDAVRIEEMLNYFDYGYAAPKDDQPFAVHTELAGVPWKKEHKLLRVGIKGREIEWKDRKSTNLVFLLDVSGSMMEPNTLPLVQQGLKLLVDELGEKDRVAMVVYAGSSGLVLPSTSATKKDEILAAIDRLQAGGSTNGGEGIQLAYKVAHENFIKDGINRVILATDGDFNVGTTSEGDLIQEKTKTGVFLTVLGFGSGNYQDANMEKIADKGNGNYAYIDSLREAKKVLVEQVGGTMMTIAKDVKIQVEFNPTRVASYRLIGYENRVLNKEDFNDDKKDAGEIGAGHNVTALYEIVPAGMQAPGPQVDSLKYQKSQKPILPIIAPNTEEWLTVKLRYKKPAGDVSSKIEYPVKGEAKEFAASSTDFKFAAAVAGFGMLLRESEHKGNITFDSAREMAIEGKGEDSKGYRSELIRLIERAKQLKASTP